jgi:uncharacterized protein
VFRFGIWLLSLCLFAGTAAAQNRAAPDTGGTVVVVPAYGEVRHPNDEAHATFMVEEQDKDKTIAASRVNQKMNQGTDIVKREDPQAILKTFGYYTYPVYSDEQIQPRQNKPRQLIGWRVGQYLEVRTTNLAALPKMAAAAQQILALNGLQFGLTEATARKLEAQQIAAAYANLTDRIAAVARAMGRNVEDAVMDTVDFEGSGAYAPQQERAPKAMRFTAAAATQVEEPSFEPGETTLNMRVVGRIRFK